MANAAKAFLTGFMGEAAKQIKEENERLENYALTRANQLIKEMDEFDEEKKKYASELRQQARDLSTYIAAADPALTRAQVEKRVSGILLNGQGKRVVSMFEDAQKAGKLTKEMAGIFKPDEDVKEQAAGIVEETIGKLTTGVKKAGSRGYIPTKGAFGLPSTSYKDTMQQAAATRGLSLDEFAAKRLPTLEEVGPPPEGKFDVNVFAAQEEAPTKTVVEARFAQKIAFAETDAEKQSLIKQRDEYLKGFPPDKKEKALTFSNAVAGFNVSIREAVDRNTIKLGAGQFIPRPDGSLGFRGDAKEQAAFNQIKIDALKNATARYANANGVVPEEIANALNMFGIKVGKDNRPMFEQAATPAPAIRAEVRSEGGKFYVIAGNEKSGPYEKEERALKAASDFNSKNKVY